MHTLKTEMTIAVALTTDVERNIRIHSGTLSEWLNNAKTYTWFDFKVFVFKSYGYFRWEEEMAELIQFLDSYPTDAYAVKVKKLNEDIEGDVQKFRLDELLTD